MKRRWIVPALVVLAQVALLVVMAGQREWVVRTGERVRLRTAPVDPRDPMRGDYVRLNYEISQVPAVQGRDGVARWLTEGNVPGQGRRYRDRVVYAWLEREPDGTFGLVALSDQRPADGLFLRGRVESVYGGMVNVRYGLEALFMQQGDAGAFEREAVQKAGVPVLVEAAVGSNGVSVLQGYSWAPLGLTVELVSEPSSERKGSRRRLTHLVVEWANHSDEPQVIVADSRGRTLALIADPTREPKYEWVGQAASDVAEITSSEVVRLEPGARHRVSLDVSDPRWFVRRLEPTAEEPVPLASVDDWAASFCLEYRPPSGDAMTRVAASSGEVSAVRLRTRPFHPRHGLD